MRSRVRSLVGMVRTGAFREDLFYRLNVVHIVVPPLRERREDIPLLARALMAKHADELHKQLDDIDPAAMRALVNHDFPGNVRELENYIERAVTLASGTVLHRKDLPQELEHESAQQLVDLNTFPDEGIILERELAGIERRFIEAAMQRAENIKTRAAQLLGLSFRSLRYRMQKLGMKDTDELVEPSEARAADEH